MIVVVDASLLVDALVGAGELLARVSVHELHAPASVDAEVLNGVRREWLRKFIDDDEAAAVIRLLQHMKVHRHSVAHLVPRMWAMRNNVSTYDAGYVALAESLDVPLLTRDARLSRSSGHTARVEFIA